MRVIVGGALANKPWNGGEAWVRLSWIRGLARLGCEVWFVEQIDPAACRDDAGRPAAPETSANAAFFRRVTAAFGLDGRAALFVGGGDTVHGPAVRDLAGVASSADLLVNISGHLADARLFPLVRRRAFVDIDPGYTQCWHESGTGGARLDGHHVFFTIGERIGSPGCDVPTCGRAWIPVRQPVVLDDWPAAAAPPAAARFTTVGGWRGTYGIMEWRGRRFGPKAHEFRKVIDLPRRAAGPFEIALDIHEGDAADRARLDAHGWRLVNPLDVAADPEAFRGYVAGSAAEFSVAQGLYVGLPSGWFSDRSVRYLASGRPVLVQDTGFTEHLPAGEGLLAFRTVEEAAAGADRIAGDWERHAAAARRLAEAFFDSDRVLAPFLDRALR